MARISVGTVTPVPKGDYNATTTYNRLNWVKYNGALYCCKANGVVGVSPENTEFWMKQLDAPTDADGVSYDNSTSGLEADKVQGAIDEVVADLGTVNDEVDDLQNDVNKLKITNLLNPTLQTQTVNGVTCTNNGDGTYTLNGTASSSGQARFLCLCNIRPTESIKLISTPPNNTEENSFLTLALNEEGIPLGYDLGNGVVINPTNNVIKSVDIIVQPNATVNNLVFKPMLTTDLTATYDDFVPYTGDTGTIQGDLSQAQKTREMISDEWISTKTYAVGEYCIHSNKLWKCKVQNSNVTPTEGTYWEKVSVGSELSELKRFKFSNGTAITVGTKFTAPSDGYIKMTIGANTNVTCDAYINDVLMYRVASNPTSANIANSLFIKKGAECLLNGSAIITSTFYELK